MTATRKSNQETPKLGNVSKAPTQNRGQIEIARKYKMDGGLDYEIVIVGAVRYALGRRTYVVSSTVNYVLANLDRLSPKARGTMASDIMECRDLGHQTDIDNWVRLLDALESPETLPNNNGTKLAKDNDVK